MTKIRRTFLTRDDIVEKLRKTITASGLSREKWARQHDCSTTLVNHVLYKKVPPGPKILKALGIETTPHFPIIHRETNHNTEPEPHVEDWNDNNTGDKTDAT
ncbi:MAG TPA: hypothetical protein V6C97_26990 [Oculatellaceae cyanobacterium]